MIRKYHNQILQTNPRHHEEEPHTVTRHQEEKKIKATSSLFPIKTIAKLQWTQSSAQQNIGQLQYPTIGVTIINESTTTQQKHHREMDTSLSHWGAKLDHLCYLCLLFNAFAFVNCCLVVTCWEMADLLALVCDV